MKRRGARVGAAAFVLGVSLAGPQATGIAAADGTDTDSAAVTAGPAAPAGRAADRAGQADRSTGHPAPSTASPTPADSAAARVGARVTRSTKASPNSGPAHHQPARSVPSLNGPVPAAAATATGPSVTPTAVVGVATTRRGRTAAPVVRPPQVASAQIAPGVLGPAAMMTVAVTGFFDSASHWLSGLPASPLTDFLQGTLLLVRRTVLTLMPGAGASQTGTQTQATPYLTEQELRDYLLSMAHQQYAGQFGQTVPVYNYYPYPVYKLDGTAGPTSDTNNQVNGVDEADFVETDGHYVYVARNNALTIMDGSTISSQTSLSGNVVGQFLDGDRLTVITQTGGGWYGPMVKMAPGAYWNWNWNPQTTVTVYDLTDRTAPTVAGQTVFDGAYRDSRAVDGNVYLVLDRNVNLPAPEYTDEPVAGGPVPDADVRGDSSVIAYRTYETWDHYAARVGDQITTLSLPHAYTVDADGNTVDLGVIAGAGDVVRPGTGDQQSMVTVVAVDSHNPSPSGFSSSVATFTTTNSSTVYMTTDALYLATAQDNYTDLGSSTDTRIDRFTIDGTEVGWQASGVVTGTLINQFAMDEQDGYLRVATHNWSSQFAGSTWATVNDSGVYVLDTTGDTLDVVGSVTGIAPGEQLYSVRFAGDKAYLVTFLRTDPLFVIDLSDPTAPTVEGELVIPGFSNYLQSVGDGLLLGIGQEREAGTWNTRLHVSLFDVTNGSTPTQIDRQILDENAQWSGSDAQFDSHALLYSAEDGLLVVPVSGGGYDAGTGAYHYENLLSVMRVDADGIHVVGQIQTDQPVLRTVRIGDVLYAVSDDQVTAYSLTDLSEISRTPLGASSTPEPLYAM
ncbi:MAG: beta-propeller domain-containing protein [Mycobacterium sp.]